MGSVMEQGLLISLVGLLLTFTALGLLILVIGLLQAVFRPRPVASEVEAPAASEPTAGMAGLTAEETVAAIATAISYLRAQDERSSDLGAALPLGRGRWWQPRVETDLPARVGAHNGRHMA